VSLRIAILLTLVGVVPAALSLRAQIDPSDSNIRAALSAILQDFGLNASIDDAESLKPVARDPRSAARSAAATAFGMMSPTPDIVAELRRLVDDSNNGVAVAACQSLAGWKDRSWMEQARGRLGSLDPRDRVLISGLLARMGDYTGWPHIKAAIVGAEPVSARTALYSAVNFVGMEDSYGKEVDIALELELLSSRVPAAFKKELATSAAEARQEQAKPKGARRWAASRQ
jgi:HEAT repeat protein